MTTSRALKPPRARYAIAGALFALLGALPSACTFDPKDRCGKNQLVWGDNELCVCDTKSAYTAMGCVPCGEHEVPGANGCVCEAGYSRRSSADACEESQPGPMGLGVPCSDSDTCMDETFNHCEKTSLGTGYCTSAGCTTTADCPNDYACMAGVCKQPPVGQAKSCTSNADCAGTEATYCDTFASHSCLVQGCSVAPNDCFDGWDCCDLTAFGVPQPICVLAGGCPA